MKKFSIRLSGHQAEWLQTGADAAGVPCSEYLRDLVEAQMQHPDGLASFKLEVLQPMPLDPEAKKQIRYNIMNYQLLEQMVLQEKNGAEMKEIAYANTLALLTQFRIHPDKNRVYKLTIFFTPQQALWLEEQAKVLNKRVVYLLRKIIFLSRDRRENGSEGGKEHPLHPAQQESLRYAVMTHKLLEQHLLTDYGSGAAMLAKAYQEGNKRYAELNPAEPIQPFKSTTL